MVSAVVTSRLPGTGLVLAAHRLESLRHVGSSPGPSDQTHVSFIGRQILHHPRKPPYGILRLFYPDFER